MATISSRPVGHEQTQLNRPRSVKMLFLAVDVMTPALLVFGFARAWSNSSLGIATMCLWVATAALADSLTVGFWAEVFLTMSLPVTIAAGMLFAPPIAGVIAFLGAFDRREWSGELQFDHALYNRCQVAISVTASSWVFHLLNGNALNYPAVLAAAGLALAADGFTNTCLVTIPVGLMKEVNPVRAARMVYAATWPYHLGGYISLGFLGLSLATAVAAVGPWGLAIVLLPIVAIRQMFVQARRAEQADVAIRHKDRALIAASQSLAEERRDERLAVAGELHDEVLPPLFKVHLMGQVIRRDLDSGRLLDLDQDLPDLLLATEAAQEAIRSLVGDLLRSPLGPDGLVGTIRLLASQLESQTSARIELALSDVDASHLAQLLAYQVAREALSNAVRHSEARVIRVRISQDVSRLRIVIEDDGVGFDASLVDGSAHFGLRLIAERVRAAGGEVAVDSGSGNGTWVVAAIPNEIG